MHYKSGTPVVSVSIDEVQDAVYDYTHITDEDDDEMVAVKSYLASLPYEEQVIAAMRFEGHCYATIGAFINKSHTYALKKFKNIIDQCRSLHIQ